MKARYQVVDLGTKEGGAIMEFSRKGHVRVPKLGKIRLKNCLGVDRQEKYKHKIGKLGCNFLAADIMSEDFKWPEADYYLAWDFLEHLPTKVASDWVLGKMLKHSDKGVWLRMPSFEQDHQGEGVLREHGLRFSWSHWHGHPSHYLVSDAKKVIDCWPQPSKTKVAKNKRIYTSANKEIVPVGSPIDTTKYHKSLGKKPPVKFKPPLVGQWEVVVLFIKEN